MLSRNTTITIAAKSLILLVNFALVVFSTHIWGSTGRGEIALVMANISIITIFSNVFCGSTIAFHAPRLERDFLLIVSLTGALLLSLTGAALCALIVGFNYFVILFLISLLLSLTTAVSSYWLGKSNFTNYNLLTLLLPLFILISLSVFFFIFKKTSLSTYFNAYLIGSGMVLIIGIASLVKVNQFKVPDINVQGIKNIFNYGLNNEINSLIQFGSSRMSYFFIASLLGLAQLGIFSIAISISEAVWVISRSMSAIHFSHMLNSNDHLKNQNETQVLARQNLWISLLVLLIAISIPASVYQFIFGKEFGEIKKFILYIIPGIIAVSVSNIYDQYFSGIGNLKIIINRSIIGLLLTLVLLPVLITKFQLTGVCISLNVSYISSLFYIWSKFKNERKLLKSHSNLNGVDKN
jgi:O-antigen/teichoic acid export membrane protein